MKLYRVTVWAVYDVSGIAENSDSVSIGSEQHFRDYMVLDK